MKMKAKTKRWVAGILGAAVLFGVFAFTSHISNGFDSLNPKDWEVQNVNEENLIKAENYTIGEEYDIGTGVKVYVNDNGTFIVDGEHGGSDDLNVEIGTVELKAGTYTFKSGYKGAGVYKAYLKLVTDDGYKKADFDNPIEITADTTAKIVLVICSEAELNTAKFAPTLAEGTEAIDFFE